MRIAGLKCVQSFALLGEVGLEPTKPEGGGVTARSNCHYTTLPKEHHYATRRAGKKRLQMRPDYLVNGVSWRWDSNPRCDIVIWITNPAHSTAMGLQHICRHRDSNPNFLVPKTSASTSWAMSANNRSEGIRTPDTRFPKPAR